MTAVSQKNNLMHSRAAYMHALTALPSPDDLRAGTIRQNGYEFSRAGQIQSQVIELGWAFFVRYEGCLENFIKVQLGEIPEKFRLEKWLIEHNVQIPSDYVGSFKLYRDIRNSLHHDDGASIDGSSGTEIHLMPEHMERFFDLFCWIGKQVEDVVGRQKI